QRSGEAVTPTGTHIGATPTGTHIGATPAAPTGAIPGLGTVVPVASTVERAPTSGPMRPPLPDPEVTARPQRRTFTAEYKRSVLQQADACQDAGAIGALLRREGLYSSHLTTWRRQRQRGELEALTPKKRGPKVVLNPLVLENRKLQAENARLQKRLQDAELIIDVQKKLSALLNSPIPEAPIHDEENA
ncbi:MAG: transposase, partial [Acidobacteriaceae bacterium]